MIICSKCKTKNKKGSIYCQKCGFKLSHGKTKRSKLSEEVEKIDDVIFKPKKRSNFWAIFVLIGVLILAAGGVYFYLSQKNTSLDSPDVHERLTVSPSSWEKRVDREFTFPLRDMYGNFISNIGYSIETAELRDEIITEGKRATAVKGRMFLVLILKITNQYNKSIKINTRDYVRLSVNNDNNWMAPEVHNDPVEIQAISTKDTRVGFIVNESDNNFRLQVGELNSTKTVVELN